jgi:glycosyltransferase involved in cell wall biosynthesis
MKVLFLSKFMKKGYGVSEVIQHLSEHLVELGWECEVIAEEADSHFDITTTVIGPNIITLQEKIFELNPDVICAHTSPYIEILPYLNFDGKSVVYEHGEPSPEFFEQDRFERERIKSNKRASYSRVSGVIAISNFIAFDIGWPDAFRIYNGCDHIKDFGEKPQVIGRKNAELKIGILSRLGEGESRYKNTDLAFELVKMNNIKVSIMGKGTEFDSKRFKQAGIEVILNADDSERETFLRGIDILVSPSLWEGFNLPVIEAQAAGTLAIAFDTGSHPEVTPFIASNLIDMKRVISNWEADRQLMHEQSVSTYKFARSNFSWRQSAIRFDQFVNELKKGTVSNSAYQPTFATTERVVTKVLRIYHQFGLRFTVKKILRRLVSIVVRTL